MAKDRLAKGMYWDKNLGIVEGCDSAGAGCLNCWAKANHERWGSQKNPPDCYSRPFSEVRVFPDKLAGPLRRKRPTRYAPFGGDLFHKDVPDEIIDRTLATFALCRQHTLIVLTKRWERMAEFLGDQTWREQIGWTARALIKERHDQAESERLQASISDPLIDGDGWPLPNVWLGVSVSTQAELDAATPHLFKTPATVKVLSLEPLLMGMYLKGRGCQRCYGRGAMPGVPHVPCKACFDIDGIFVGCESGPNRRPCPIEHIESVVGQGKAAGVPVFVKQVDIDGRVSKDPAEWPESIQVREMPG